MKKHLLFALGVACAATCLTACHDSDGSDDEDGASYAFDASSVVINESVIGSASAKTGVETYTLTSNMISVYCYDLGDKQTIIDSYIDETTSNVTNDGLTYLGENFYGGFTPIWFDANDENLWYLSPTDTTSNAKYSSLLCNPGDICKALFHKELAISTTGLMSVVLVKGPVSITVAPIALYSEMENGNSDGIISDYTALPAGDEIRFVVYGYIDSFNVSSWDKTLSTFKGIWNSTTSGGQKSANYITLAKADSNGNVTVNKDWQKMSLTDLDDYYCFECYIEVVKSDGTKDTSYTLCDDLKYCTIKNISFDGRLGSIL